MRKKFVINFITLLIVVILGTSIIWPKFSQILENRKSLKDGEEKLAVLTQKSQKIEQLNQELSQNPKNQETILKYIPTARSEDFLINYLDGISYAEGVGVIRNVVLEEKNVNNSFSQIMPENSQAYPGETLSSQISPQPVFLTVKFDSLSNYEKIVAFLEKINGLKRFNKPTYLKIVKSYPEDKKEDATLDLLEVSLGLDFNYLKKIASRSEIGKDVFEKEDFDNEVLRNIEKKAVNDISDPESRSDGRNNPFIP